LIDIAQIAGIQRRKQRTLIAIICLTLIFVLACVFRLVPTLDDLLAGRPPYTQAMTFLMAQEITRGTGDRSPVILLGADEHCTSVPQGKISDDEIAAVLYVLTYSEQQRFSCITSYAVPVDPSKFADLQILPIKAEWMSTPAVARPLKVLPVARNMHVYPVAYLESLNWRVTPHFPISESQAANLAPRQYESRNSAVQTNERAGINIDFEKARAIVQQRHDQVNTWLMGILAVLVFAEVGLALSLVQPYRLTAQFVAFHEDHLPPWDFLTEDIVQRASGAEMQYQEREQARQAQERRMSAESALREDLEERLRFFLGNLQDEALRQRIQQCLDESADPALMKQLYAEAQKAAGVKSPEQRLTSLLESLEPLCTQEELNACREEAMRLLDESGFREARNYLVLTHAQFRLRMRRQVEEEQENADAGTGTGN